MKVIITRRVVISSSLLLMSLIVGCASLAVSDDAILKKTAFELGLEPSDFTVSNRQDDGVTSTYVVKAKGNKIYNCTIGGSISVLGRTVTSPICNEVGKAPTCNALQKAAGKC